MSPAQQSLYHMCEAAGTERVGAALTALRGIDRRDLPFLLTRAALNFYLKDSKQ